MNETTDKVKSWMHSNPALFGKLVALAILLFGVLVIIGAVRNWDWIFKPDESYHNRWTIGQVSRYAGRNTARVIGFVGGVLLVVAGAAWSYKLFTRG
jgi:hypothetical protein